MIDRAWVLQRRAEIDRDQELVRRFCPYHHLIPTDPVENLRWRRHWHAEAMRDPAVARELWIMCSRDILFWINGFVVTIDPRITDRPVGPFIAWDFQRPVIVRIMRAIFEGRSLLIEKSRDQGASWMCLLVFLWFWLFRPRLNFLLASRKEDLVDKTGDLDSLMQKLDFVLKHLPAWMRPDEDNVDRSKLHLGNLRNGTSIDGESTNNDLGRGGRRTAVLLDEFAAVAEGFRVVTSIQNTTSCRIYNSTPQGAAGAFYDLRGRKAIEKISLHWTLHPMQSLDLYWDANDRPHSPWYDRQCEEAVHPQQIAQELDLDYAASDFQFFDEDVLRRIVAEDVRPPFLEGELEYDEQSGRPLAFVQRAGGPLKLWCYLQPDSRPLDDRTYIIGADIAAGRADDEGRGASNSVLSIVDCLIGEKCGELALTGVPPHEFAALTVAVCRWFGGREDQGAFLIWEDNGPGENFGQVVVELGYLNIYFRTSEQRMSKKVSDTPGWWSGPVTKRALLGAYRRALAERRFVNRSAEAIEECRAYVYLANNTVMHARAARSTNDPTGARENHGDRVIADALANWVLKTQRQEAAPELDPNNPPPGSLAWRRLQRRKAA